MAGEVYWYADYIKKVFNNGTGNWGSKTIYCGLCTSALNPFSTDPDPQWGGGTTNAKTHQCTPGGDYADDGAACSSVSAVRSGATIQFKWTAPVAWNQEAGNPNNARYAVFYDYTTKECIGFMDLGQDRDLTLGELLITMPDPALTITVT